MHSHTLLQSQEVTGEKKRFLSPNNFQVYSTCYPILNNTITGEQADL